MTRDVTLLAYCFPVTTQCQCKCARQTSKLHLHPPDFVPQIVHYKHVVDLTFTPAEVYQFSEPHVDIIYTNCFPNRHRLVSHHNSTFLLQCTNSNCRNIND